MVENSGAKVVLVDDEWGARVSLHGIIEECGSKVHAFENGNDALIFYQEHHADVDVILTDIHMPGIDGIELLNKVLAINSEVPVILISGFVDIDLTLAAIKNGAFDFIPKPYDPEYVIQAITKAVTYRRLRTFEKSYRDDLEKALQNQARELKKTNEIVLQNEKMALVGQIAAGVAHEINNPLGFISSNLRSLDKYIRRMVDLVKDQSESLNKYCPPEELERIGEARKNVRIDKMLDDIPNLLTETHDGLARIKEIIANLKGFSRTDTDEYVQSDINEILKKALNIVKNEIKYVATIITDLGDIPAIQCLPNQLMQVFMNLLINAAHAIEKQGEINVRSWQESENVYVSISDTGCGIPDEFKMRIFEPFFTTKEAGKGTGLGLSISYDLIQKHSGELTVESTLGVGTTFKVRLPIVS